MSRPKIARKSTSVDMTAMCDVAFLLLSFFILTTKFKPSEAVTVSTPNSVAAKVAPDKDFVTITIDKNNKVYLSMDDEDIKREIGARIMSEQHVQFNIEDFAKSEFFASPFAQMPQFFNVPKEERKSSNVPGLLVQDSAHNELMVWMRMIQDAYVGKKMNLMIKGDDVAKYPAFKLVLDAFKKYDFLQFQLITNPESVPKGSDLWTETVGKNKTSDDLEGAQ